MIIDTAPCNSTAVNQRVLAVMQPYFLPYLGYFQLMAKADAFVLFDDVHFINRGWINRNRINIQGSDHLLTIPLRHASQNKRICDIEISGEPTWRGKMLRSFQQAYARAPQFGRVLPLLERIVHHPAENLADYLRHSLTQLRDYLGLGTVLIDSSRRYDNQALKAQERIIDICRQERAGLYINAVGGQTLYERSAFETAGMRLAFLNPTLKPYAAGRGGFLPGLSIVDVLMNEDSSALSDHLQAGTLS